MTDVENPADNHEDTGCWAGGSKNTKDEKLLFKKPILVEFRDFVLGGNLIRIGVAFVLALALESLIKSFVNAFISPILGVIGANNIEDLFFTVRGSRFKYGLFLDSLLSFVTICLVLFFVLILPLQRYGGRCVPAWVIRKCPFCYSDMPAIGTKCPSCTSEVDPLNIVPGKEA